MDRDGAKQILSQRVAVLKTDCVEYVGLFVELGTFTALEVVMSQCIGPMPVCNFFFIFPCAHKTFWVFTANRS